MEGLLIGWRRGDAGGVVREEERDKRGGVGLENAVEGEDGVVGGVNRGSLGLGRPEFVGGQEEDTLDKDAFGLMMEGEEGPNLFVARSS